MNMIVRAKVKPECVADVQAGAKKMFSTFWSGPSPQLT